MPTSVLHDALVELIRQAPEQYLKFAQSTFQATGLNPQLHIRIGESDFSDVYASEFRADIVLLAEKEAAIEFSTITEVQLQRDDLKVFSAAHYAATQFARTHKPVVVLIVTPKAAVAKWARGIAHRCGIGPPNQLKVIGPEQIPWITKSSDTCGDSILWCLLSALAHGKKPGGLKVAEHAVRLVTSLAPALEVYYTELILLELPEKQCQELKALLKLTETNMPTIPAGWEPTDPDLKRRYQLIKAAEASAKAEGKAEGEAKGEARALIKVLEVKGFGITKKRRERILETVDCQLLEQWLSRAVSATTVGEVFRKES